MTWDEMDQKNFEMLLLGMKWLKMSEQLENQGDKCEDIEDQLETLAKGSIIFAEWYKTEKRTNAEAPSKEMSKYFTELIANAHNLTAKMKRKLNID